MSDDARSPMVSDEDLVEQALGGQAEALDELVDRHHPVVYRVVLRLLADGDLAADATQETFLKAFRGLPGYRRDARFRSWLLAIAANEARAMLRRLGRRAEQPVELAGQIPDPVADAAAQALLLDEAERVRQLLAGLPEKQRLAVQLRTQEGLSFREVGGVIGSSEGAARVNYHHGITKLREMLKCPR